MTRDTGAGSETPRLIGLFAKGVGDSVTKYMVLKVGRYKMDVVVAHVCPYCGKQIPDNGFHLCPASVNFRRKP